VQQTTIVLRDAGHAVHVLNHFGSHSGDGPVIGTLRRNPLLYFIRLSAARAAVVHYHHAGRLSLVVAVALALRRNRNARWVITVHNHSVESHLARPPAARIMRWALNRFDQIVAVSSTIGTYLEDHGVTTPIVILPAYVRTPTPRPTAVAHWRPSAFFDRPGETLVVAAYRVSPLDSRGDLYGVDIAAETFVALAKERTDLKLAIFLSNAPRGRRAKRYLRFLLNQITPEIRGRVGVWTGEQLLPALRPRVVFLRPTQTDGDAVSVREALELGVPVVASDCTTRPAGVTTAKVDDVRAWRVLVGKKLTELGDGRVPSVASSSTGSDCRTTGEQHVLELYSSQLDHRSPLIGTPPDATLQAVCDAGGFLPEE